MNNPLKVSILSVFAVFCSGCATTELKPTSAPKISKQKVEVRHHCQAPKNSIIDIKLTTEFLSSDKRIRKKFKALLTDVRAAEFKMPDSSDIFVKSVYRGFCGDIIVSGSALLNQSPLTSPETKAILTPFEHDPNNLVISLDQDALKNTKFKNESLVLEVDTKKFRPFVGKGSTYFLKPNIKEIQIGLFRISTLDAQGWSSIRFNPDSPLPDTVGEGIKVEKISINTHDEEALIKALDAGDVALSKILIEQGVNVNYLDKKNNNRTALFLASYEGYEELVSLLLSKGANPNHRLDSGATALMVALQRGHSNIVKKLRKAGALQ